MLITTVVNGRYCSGILVYLLQLVFALINLLSNLTYPSCFCLYFHGAQVIAHGEQVFPRVREKCSSKQWFASEDISSLEELVGRLRRLKENVGFLANRVTAIQAGLDSWQAEQINKKLYYLSFLSIIFLPLSVVTGGNTLVLEHCFSSSSFAMNSFEKISS